MTFKAVVDLESYFDATVSEEPHSIRETLLQMSIPFLTAPIFPVCDINGENLIDVESNRDNNVEVDHLQLTLHSSKFMVKGRFFQVSLIVIFLF
jgi:hypothetical protein